MRFLNKAAALLVCIAILLNLSAIAYGAEVADDGDRIRPHVIRVTGNEYRSPYVTVYEYDGKYYLDLKDIGAFTRSTVTEDAGSLTLTQGIREIVIDKETGHMTDCGAVDQGNIPLLYHDGMYLCEGVPMLRYLGAACSMHEPLGFEVMMPMYTIWESIMPDYTRLYFDIYELYGGETAVNISLVCDILADVFDGISGYGLLGSYELHMRDALYDALNVDMMKYASVRQLAAAENQKINDFLTSDLYSALLSGGEKTVDAAYEALDYYAGFYLNTQFWKNSYLEKLYYEAGDLDKAAELGSLVNKQVYTQSVMQADLKPAKTNKTILSAGMLALDTAVTSYGLMQYDDDTKNLFARTINDDMFAYTGYAGVAWKDISDNITDTLKSTESIVAHTAAEKITRATVEKVAEGGIAHVVSGFTSAANYYVAAAQLGLFLGSALNYSSNQAFSADLNALLLNEAHFDVAMMASQLIVDSQKDDRLASTEHLNRLKDMFTLYYRMSISFAENIAISIDEFGGRSNQKWVDWFASTEEASVANDAAAYLYRITNCVLVPAVPYSTIADDVLTGEWLRQNSVDIRQELVSDAYFDYIVDDDYRMQCCYHIPRFNPEGGEFAQRNAEIYDELHTVMKEDVYGDYRYVLDMAYGCGMKNTCVSLITASQEDWGNVQYHVFNVDIRDGSRISTEELAAAWGLTGEAYRALARKALEAKYEAIFGAAYEANQSDGNFLKFYQEQKDATVSDQNIDALVPYIDAGGDLCAVARIYSMAGADYYHHLINLTGTDEPAAIECTADHGAEKAEFTGDALQYFIENCHRQYFTEADIETFDHQMCVYARNAVFARSGRIFTSGELADYFAACDWYEPRVEPEDFSNDMLNTIQRANVDLVLAREEKLELEALLNSLGGEKGIYTRYLHGGGYDEILGSYYDKDELEISACLADLDGDGIGELLLHMETGQSGIRGLEAHTVLLDMKGDKVFIAAQAYFGGGSMGGDHLQIRYDSQTKKHVLVLDGYIRDGASATGSYLQIYSAPGFKVDTELHSSYYSLYSDWYQETIDQIRRETSLYEMDADSFRCYQIDDKYVSKAAFDKASARYEQPREGFRLKSGTYAKPIA